MTKCIILCREGAQLRLDDFPQQRRLKMQTESLTKNTKQNFVFLQCWQGCLGPTVSRQRQGWSRGSGLTWCRLGCNSPCWGWASPTTKVPLCLHHSFGQIVMFAQLFIHHILWHRSKFYHRSLLLVFMCTQLFLMFCFLICRSLSLSLLKAKYLPWKIFHWYVLIFPVRFCFVKTLAHEAICQITLSNDF